MKQFTTGIVQRNWSRACTSNQKKLVRTRMEPWKSYNTSCCSNNHVTFQRSSLLRLQHSSNIIPRLRSFQEPTLLLRAPVYCGFRSSTTVMRNHRAFSSPSQSSKPTPQTESTSGSSKISSIVWPLATLAIVGGTFYGVGLYFSDLTNMGKSSVSATTEPVDPQAPITSRAYLDIAIDKKPVGRIVIGLHGDIVPKTVYNFETLCRGDTTLGNVSLKYSGSTFHRIIPGFMIQGGDFTKHNGTGGRSVYGAPLDGRFADENFVLQHVGPGIVSMANSGPNTNGSQFFITTSRTSHLNKRHVVFGTVIEGWDVVQLIESYGCSSGRPAAEVRIVDAGVLTKNDDLVAGTTVATNK